MAKKVSRKQLLKEPDEFITLTGKMIRFFKSYQKQIAIVIGIAAVIFLTFSGINFFINRIENKAFTLLNQANAEYRSALAGQDAMSALKEVEKDFDMIIEKYSRYQAGKIARVNFANYYYQAGDYDRAAELFTVALENIGKNPLYQNLILSGLGYSYKAKNDYETSAKYFEMIASSTIHILKDEALYNLGQLYAILGKDDQRTQVLNSIITEHPESIYIELAREQLPG